MQKVIGMEKIQKFLPTELYELYISQELNISWTPISIADEFLGKYHINIKEPLLVSFLAFDIVIQ